MERIADGIAATWSKALYRDWNGSVHVQNVSFGSWAPRPDCPTPRLWVLLTGHTRTFSWTRDFYILFMIFGCALHTYSLTQYMWTQVNRPETVKGPQG